MENLDLVLEAEREELVLDRPPLRKQNELSSSPADSSPQLSLTPTSSQISTSPQISASPQLCPSHQLSSSPLSTLLQLSTSPEVTSSQLSTFPQLTGSRLSTSPPLLSTSPSTVNDGLPKAKPVVFMPAYTASSSSRKALVSCLKKSNSANNVKKNIGFMEGEKIVSQYIEPVDPWKNVRTPSHTEIVSFYRNSCQKLRCKPLDKLIKQIQEIPDLSTRVGTLVLRGCRLDNKSCEALEAVFRRVQFENLDVENCSLEEEGASSIIEMVEFYRTTCKLNIACNPKLGIRGWQSLCRMLRKTPCLTYLDARRTLLTDMTAACFGRCLKASPYLKVLHLEGVFLSGRPLLILATAMKYNHVLEELYIGDNDLSATDGSPLGAMLTYNTTLQLLDIRNNQIKDVGLSDISNGLSDQAEQPFGGGLCSLILWNNGLTHEGMTYLSSALMKTTSLKALNLGQNRIGDLGMQRLKSGLIKNKSLKKLGFLNTKIGSEGAVALAEVLADSLLLSRIDLRGNNLQVAGLMAFAMALKVNQSLLRLDLDKDMKKEQGMESVMQTVLVDIYNLCHRNKKMLNPISRQPSTVSESTVISGDDIFHPENLKQPVTPFSPVADKNAPFEMPDGNLEPPPAMKTSDAHLKSPPPPSNKKKSEPIVAPKRASRFSVTKIWDSLGNHAAKIATNVMDIKRNNKESEMVEVSDKNLNNESTNVQTTNLGLQDNVYNIISDTIQLKIDCEISTEQESLSGISEISTNEESNSLPIVDKLEPDKQNKSEINESSQIEDLMRTNAISSQIDYVENSEKNVENDIYTTSNVSQDTLSECHEHKNENTENEFSTSNVSDNNPEGIETITCELDNGTTSVNGDIDKKLTSFVHTINDNLNYIEGQGSDLTRDDTGANMSSSFSSEEATLSQPVVLART